jgi:MFS family permease
VLGTYLATAAGYFIVGNPLFQNEAYPSLPWRLGFVLGALPAVLIVWIRRGLREPESWEQARARASADASQSMGRVAELFQGELRRRTLVGVSLATVGLATFWGVHIYGKNLMRRDMSPLFVPVEKGRIAVSEAQRRESLAPLLARAQRDAAGALVDSAMLRRVADLFITRDWQQARLELRRIGESDTVQAVAVLPPPKSAGQPEAAGAPLVEVLYESGDQSRVAGFVALMTATKNRINERLKLWEMCGMLLVTTGGGLGLLAFGPMCERVGRRGAFLVFHVGGLLCSVATFQWAEGRDILFAALPLFGFFTLGMHAGYAIYFPELYPTRLRGTGAGFCFNAGRIMVPPVLYLSGWLQDVRKITPEDSYSLLGLLYLAGVLVLLIAPETKGRQLPE